MEKPFGGKKDTTFYFLGRIGIDIDSPQFPHFISIRCFWSCCCCIPSRIFWTWDRSHVQCAYIQLLIQFMHYYLPDFLQLRIFLSLSLNCLRLSFITHCDYRALQIPNNPLKIKTKRINGMIHKSVKWIVWQ